MGRSPCCAKEGLNRGSWTAHEDRILTEYIKVHGEGHWRNLPKRAGLKRCGKSCRLRWLNYLRPDIKRGNISQDEEELIIRLHKLLGNRWSLIAGRLPGRTDNEIKNYWNTNLCKKVKADSDQMSSANMHSQVLQHKHFQKNKIKLNLSPKTKEVSTSTSSKFDNSKMSSNHQVVVRTKAVKCTKVFINPIGLPYNNNNNTSIDHHQQSQIEKTSGDLGGRISLDQEFNIFSTIVGSDHQDNNISTTSDFIMNFNVEDFCLSDFLNSDNDYVNYKNDDHNSNEILDLDDELLLQEWNGKDCVDEFNFHHQIPSFFHGEEWLDN